MKRSAPAQSLHKSKSHCRQPTVNVPVTVSWQSSQMIELSSIPGSNSCPHGHLIVLPRASKKCENEMRHEEQTPSNTSNTSVKQGSVASFGPVICDQLSTVTTRERAQAAKTASVSSLIVSLQRYKRSGCIMSSMASPVIPSPLQLNNA